MERNKHGKNMAEMACHTCIVRKTHIFIDILVVTQHPHPSVTIMFDDV